MKKYLFIDRDGTLIEEPDDFQIDSFDKFILKKEVLSSLKTLSQEGYTFIMVSNQDGLGTEKYPQEKFDKIQKLLLQILSSENIFFEDILICKHTKEEKCLCRKPQLGLVQHKFEDKDLQYSFVIGDRPSDMLFAENMNIAGIALGSQEFPTWKEIVSFLKQREIPVEEYRQTQETKIKLKIHPYASCKGKIETNLPFLTHMLEQIQTHGLLEIYLEAYGDIEIDAHHLVEDVALTLGLALRKLILRRQNKIERFGFVLPMDDAQVSMSMDLGGRPYLEWENHFKGMELPFFPMNLAKHFFRSLSSSIGCNIHLSFYGEDAHHTIEALFKALGRCLKQALSLQENILSSKGSLF